MPHQRFVRLTQFGLVAVIFAIYLPVRTFEFLHYDDRAYVMLNPDIAQGLNWRSIAAVFSHSYVASWGPAAMMSHAADISLFGMNPGMHHLASVVLHAVNSLLVFHVWRRMTGRVAESAVLAALWAVHPQRVEAVAWISSRKDLLSTLFMLLTLLAYCGYVRRGGWRRYSIVVAALIVGLLAKPMLVTLPCVLLLLDFWPLGRVAGRRSAVRLVAEKAPLFLVSFVFMVVTQYVQTAGGAVTPLERLGMGPRLENVATAYASYLFKAAWPYPLSVFYPNALGEASAARVFASAALITAISLLAAAQWRRRPYVFVGWFWFVGTLVPVIGLVMFGSHGMADRYTYVAHLGLFTAVVWLGAELHRRLPAIRAVLAALTIAGLGAASVYSAGYVRAFRDTYTVFAHARDVVGINHSIVLTNLALGMMDRGAYYEPIKLLQFGSNLWPKSPTSVNNLGKCWIALGRTDLALEAFVESGKRTPSDMVTRQNIERAERALDWYRREIEALTSRMGESGGDLPTVRRLAYLQFEVGSLDEAESIFRFLAESDPEDHGASSFKLGEIQSFAGRLEEAAESYSKALEAGYGPAATWYRIGDTFRALGRDGEAREALLRAIESNPSSLDPKFLLEAMDAQ